MRPDQYKPIDPVSSGIYQNIARLRRLAERDDASPEMLRDALLYSLGASEELLQGLDSARNLLAEIGKRLYPELAEALEDARRLHAP